MKKTAIQELIEILDKRIEDCNALGGLALERWAFIQAKRKATELLEKEREQIEESFDYGVNVGLRGGLSKDAEQYFNETYGG